MIKVIAKAFRVLEALHEYDGSGVRLSEIAVRVKLPTVTVFRILRTLESLGYVNFDGTSETYRLAPRLKDLGQSNIAVTVTRLARPSMMRLLAEFEQTVNLALLENGKLVYRDMIEGLQSIRMQPIPGVFLSLTESALGLSILAHLPAKEAESLILSSTNWKTLPRARKENIISELRRVRRAGYALDNEMFEKGLRCVGAPIFDKEGRPIASMSVSGSSSIITQRVTRVIAKRVKEECDRISAALGHTRQASIAIDSDFLTALPGETTARTRTKLMTRTNGPGSEIYQVPSAN
jgi:DNA-binding IclR family transcriptional regulator